MRTVLHAPNVHQGGGRTLLTALLQEFRRTPCVAILDERYEIPSGLSELIKLYRIPPTIWGRLRAERLLSSIVKPDDLVLCFGNLPPLFPNPGRVFVFLQNRYLLGRYKTAEFQIGQRLRIAIERFWLRSCLGYASLIVQSPSMAREVRSLFARNRVEVMPFAPEATSQKTPRNPASVKYDFLYVASGEPHKNHKTLIDAWEILASEGIYPSLALTLDKGRYGQLADFVEQRSATCLLRIENLGQIPASKMPALYGRSGALIYPSFFESYGLPLIEATQHGLALVAAELDYVRDVSNPSVTFDPNSAVSVARAVKRYLGYVEANDPPSPGVFLDRIRCISMETSRQKAY